MEAKKMSNKDYCDICLSYLIRFTFFEDSQLDKKIPKELQNFLNKLHNAEDNPHQFFRIAEKFADYIEKNDSELRQGIVDRAEISKSIKNGHASSNGILEPDWERVRGRLATGGRMLVPRVLLVYLSGYVVGYRRQIEQDKVESIQKKSQFNSGKAKSSDETIRSGEKVSIFDKIGIERPTKKYSESGRKESKNGDNAEMDEIDVNDPYYYYFRGFNKIFALSKDDVSLQLECLLEMGMTLYDTLYNLLYKNYVDDFNYNEQMVEKISEYLEIYNKAYNTFNNHSKNKIDYAMANVSDLLKNSYCKKFGLKLFNVLNLAEIKEKTNSKIFNSLCNTKFHYADPQLYRANINKISTAVYLMDEEQIIRLYKAFMKNGHIESDRNEITRIFSDLISKRRMNGREDDKEQEAIRAGVKTELINCLTPSAKQTDLQEALKSADERYYGLSHIQKSLAMAKEYTRYMDIIFKCRNSNLSEEEIAALTEELNGMFR